jgi:hypothetical protein
MDKMTYYTITETLIRVVEINKEVPNKLDFAKKNGIIITGRYNEKISDKREIELFELNKQFQFKTCPKCNGLYKTICLRNHKVTI